MWNLGNEPDLFAEPQTAADGRAWVRDMTALIKSIDPHHPVTCGLHAASLFADNGLRVDQVFAETDVAVMHGYPMYVDWAREPLDPDFVPYLCALVTALSGKPCLAEEWGGCTSPDTEESAIWEWTAYGTPRTPVHGWARKPSPTMSDRCSLASSRWARPGRFCGASPTTPRTSGTARRATPAAPNTNATSA